MTIDATNLPISSKSVSEISRLDYASRLDYKFIIGDAIDRYFDSIDTHLNKETIKSNIYCVAEKLFEDGKHGDAYVIGAAIMGGLKRSFDGDYSSLDDFNRWFEGDFTSDFKTPTSYECRVADSLISDVMPDLNLIWWRIPFYRESVRKIAKPINNGRILK
ncbi:MAG: hypothetical protein ABIF08_04190 [Nanoarchaeota archaeon]